MLLNKTLNQIINLVQSDLYRYTGDCTISSFVKTYFKVPGFNFMVWLRIRSIVKSKIVGYVLFKKRIRFGLDIQTISIGEGFYIGHYGTIVVSGEAVIGKNCNISQGVTIGVVNTGFKKGVPVIGDNVYIAPGAKIIGNVKIGNNVAIGANSVVTADIPDNAVVVGVPARVVSHDGSQGYIQNIYKD